MSFPEKTIGTCSECGAKDGDYAAGDLTSADSQTNLHTTGNGTELVEYDGRMVCRLCKKRLQADEESRIAAEKHAEEERFRARAGYVKLAE